MAQAATAVGNSMAAIPYITTPSEMKRKWVQTAEGVYVSPELARDESGKNRVVNIDWPCSLDAARLASERTGRIYFVASYGEALDAIRARDATRKEAEQFAEWTRNRYETIEDGGRRFTRLFSHCYDISEGRDVAISVDLDDVLKGGYVSCLALGAPSLVSGQPNPDFLDASLYYENNPVLRLWRGRFGADANYGASYADGGLGFRLVWYERKEVERMLRERNKALRQEASGLRRKITAARKSLE